MKALLHQVHWPSFFIALAATALLTASIVVGSRRLADFDSALVGYTFACLFAAFGIVYRYSVWLTKPPTRRFWKRGWMIFFTPSRWNPIARVGLLIWAVWSRILWQDFVMRRGFRRWLGHMLIAWGCILAAAVTFPLVFGWIHFEQGAIEPVPSYKVVFFGFHVSEMPMHGILSWFTFHSLIVSSFMVIAGVMIVMWRRMFDIGAVAVERFGRDFLPLILLFGVAVSGLLLWVSYEWFNGQFYNALAQFHAVTVIALLISLPFGKLFHIFQRPASLGVVFYRAAGERGKPAICPVTGENFAAKLQTDDLSEVLPELGFDYAASAVKPAAEPATDIPTETVDKPPSVDSWNQVSPRGRRMLIGRAHNATRSGKFD